MNKFSKVCLYTITSPLWITGAVFITLGLLHTGAITFSDIFQRRVKEENINIKEKK